MKSYTLNEFIRLLGISEEDDGRALWEKIANKEIYLDDIYVETGSFRYNAAEIAVECGGDYLDYYCSSGSIKAQDHINDLFIMFNVSTKPISNQLARKYT